MYYWYETDAFWGKTIGFGEKPLQTLGLLIVSYFESKHKCKSFLMPVYIFSNFGFSIQQQNYAYN